MIKRQVSLFQKTNGVQEIDDKLRKLFIGGLNEKTTEETSKEYFSQFGEVQDINILRHDDGRSRWELLKKYANSYRLHARTYLEFLEIF